MLVLGGSGVLGGEIAAELSRRGATIVLVGRNEDRLKARAEAIGPETATIVADLSQGATATTVVDTAAALIGGLDGVVNAMGTVAFGEFAVLADDVFDELVASNYTGPLRVIRAALDHLDGGFVVSISGIVAETPVAGMAAYSGVKAALSVTTRALARELRRRSVHVLDARPPHTETGLAGRAIDGVAPRLPRGLDPAAVAGVICDAIESGATDLPSTAFSS